MGVLDTSTRLITDSTRLAADTANATTAVAGAVGGATIGGVVGGMRWVVGGMRTGIGRGSHSTPAAAVGLVALGVTGLVEWPLLAGIGGGALVVNALSARRESSRSITPATARATGEPARTAPGVGATTRAG